MNQRNYWWPESLEDKWRFILLSHPEFEKEYDYDYLREYPASMFYLTEKEREFLWRIRHPNEYSFFSCRFCKKELVTNKWGMGIHFTVCIPHKEHCLIWNTEVHDWDTELRRVFFTKRKPSNFHLAGDDVFRRQGIEEFSGGPEDSEGTIIHDLIENWKTECASLCTGWVRRLQKSKQTHIGRT